MQQELEQAHKWLSAGNSIVLAVVSKTWGSAPRAQGSLMVIHKNGHFEGSVSGGCVEGSVIAEAATLMEGTKSKTLEFSVATNDAWQVGLACGGEIHIQLFPLGEQDADALLAAIDHLGRRKAGELVLGKHPSRAFFVSDKSPDKAQAPLVETTSELTIAVRPSPMLYVIGAVHITQALTPMATACGYDVTIIDPRQIFVEDRTFEGAGIINDWPDEFFASHPLDRHSAIVTLTHDPKIDDAALKYALMSDVFYIGSLGSKKTHAARVERLRENGFSDKQLGRINGPIGLNIGSKSPAEIAVAIAAQLIAAFRGMHAV